MLQGQAYAVLDKRSKLAPEAFSELLAEVLIDAGQRDKILALMSVTSIEQINDVINIPPDVQKSIDELKRLFEHLDAMDITDYCTFDIGIVRGLAYYTGIVFEIYDKASQLRAIGGGGRYDALIPLMGGDNVPASGFALYLDRLMEIVKTDTHPEKTDERILVTADIRAVKEAFRLAASLRDAGYAVEINPGGKESKGMDWVVDVTGEVPQFNLTNANSREKFEAASKAVVLKILES